MAATAVREWPDITTAPGDNVARLRAVRVRSENGDAVDVVDVRESVGIELEYEVLEPNHIFLPHFSIRNQEGMHLFVAVDVDPTWRGQRRPAGRYVSTGWIPSNLLAEGLMFVQVVLMSWNPEAPHAVVDDAVAFRVLDDLTAKDTARGDYDKAMPGLMRPLLHWTTQRLSPSGNSDHGTLVETAQLVSEQT
jgi:lipopolysaccharide transport system ATP-binding protein